MPRTRKGATQPKFITEDAEVVIWRKAGLGDVLMSLPAVRYIHDIYKKKIRYIARAEFFELLQYVPYIGRLSERVSSAEPYRLVNLVRRVDFLPLCDKAHRIDVFACVVSTEIGIPFMLAERDKEITIKLPDKYIKEGRLLFEEYGIVDSKYKICIAMAGHGKTRVYRHVRNLAKEIVKRKKCAVIILDDRKPDKRIMLSGVVDLRGRTDFSELLRLVQACDAVVTVDNGIFHLAYALDKPVVGLFGSIPSEFRKPFGNKKYKTIYESNKCVNQPCFDWQRGSCDHLKRDRYKCLQGISPAQVADSVFKLLKE